jgi:NADH-quinone oxidoreductase subunit C
MATPNLDHPTLPLIKDRFAGRGLRATEFRGDTTVLCPPDPPELMHELLSFLKTDDGASFNFLADIAGIDYLNYPPPANASQPTGRFGVVYNLISTRDNRRLFVKVLLDPTLDTHGIEDDPALHLPTVTDLWPGAEWLEREVYDMFGVHFDGNPDHRRILLWEDYPAHPLRKDYPVRGRGERENYRVIDRESA